VVALLMMLLGMGGLLRHSQSAEGRWGQASRGAAGGAVDTEVAGAIEVAESAMVPTTIDHLAVVRVSVTRCGKRAYGSATPVSCDSIMVA
jgi:hypothetical protein